MQKRATPTARRLRRDATEVEKQLWSRLRAGQLEGYKFRRQYPVGRYIADFACVSAKLVIELDGGQHTPEADADRTFAIEAAASLFCASGTTRSHRISKAPWK